MWFSRVAAGASLRDGLQLHQLGVAAPGVARLDLAQLKTTDEVNRTSSKPAIFCQFFKCLDWRVLPKGPSVASRGREGEMIRKGLGGVRNTEGSMTRVMV